jgi:hypothetical protein
MNRTITVAMRVLVILGYLVGGAESEAMDGGAAARVSLALVGLVMAVFLCYLALRGSTIAPLSRRWRQKRRFAEPRDVIDGRERTGHIGR